MKDIPKREIFAYVSTAFTTTSATFTDVPRMFFNIGPGEVWSFEAWFRIGCNNTGGVRPTWTWPSGATGLIVVHGNAGTSDSARNQYITSSGATTGNPYNGQNSQNGLIRATGMIANGPTPGKVQLQFAANTGGQTGTLAALSYMVASQRRPNQS